MALQVRAVCVVSWLAIALFAMSLAGGCTVRPLAPAPSPDLFEGGSPATDAGLPGDDAGGGGSILGDASSCQPGDVQTFQPDDYRAASAEWQGLCPVTARVDRIQQFYDACLGSTATTDSCAAFKKYHSACAACIVTPDTATRYGPLISHHGFIAPNVAGCLELSVPGALSCAKSVQALAACELAACEANCHVSDPQSLAAYDHCAASADSAGCVAYVGVAACKSLPDAGSPEVSRCLRPDFDRFYHDVVPLFCGVAPVVDADGTAPPPDGAAE